jgi:cytoskeletal protein CcmA (bactofilin family)
MRQVVVWTMVVVCVLAVRTARADPPSDVLAYAAFGIQSVTLGAKSRVDGDVGGLFDSVSLGQGARVTGATAAPAIQLKNRVHVSGGYFCQTLTGSTDACNALPNPLVGGPSIVLPSPGNLDVSAPKHAKAAEPLPPGAYRALTAGTASAVLLAGGAYQFESMAIGARAKVLCAAACDVTVRTTVTMKQGSRLGAADTVPTTDAIVRIAGQGTTTAFSAKSRTTIGASVYAPSAAVTLGAGVHVDGSLVGDSVKIGPRARLTGPGVH